MWRRALSAGGGYVGVTALYRALAAPLEVEWSLRDTLVSQRSVTDREWRPDQGNQLLRATADRIEHVDDNAKHFVTRARPHATTVIRALGWLPGVRQTVRSTASPGHLNEVLTLLDPGRQTLRAGAGASADARSRRRTVVVTSCEDTHARQPQNGIRVAPFDSQRMMLILSGGKYAIGGRFAANALDIDDVAWPLEIVAFDGSSVGGGNQMFLDGVDRSETAVRWGAPSARRREFTRRAERSARESERERAASAQAERDDLVLEAKRLLDDASRIRPGRSRPLLRATADLHDDSAEALGLLKRAGVFARDDGFQRDTALAPRDAARIARAKRLCDEAERQWFAASAARMRAEAAELLARAGVFLRAAEAVEAREHEADRAAAAQRAERANGGRLRGEGAANPSFSCWRERKPRPPPFVTRLAPRRQTRRRPASGWRDWRARSQRARCRSGRPARR